MAKKSADDNKRPPTKSEIMDELADKTGLAKKDVQNVFDEFENLVKKHLKRSPGVFAIPGLMKITKQRKPKQPQRQGRNPATGETITIPPKPAQNTVKVRPLKRLKEMV